jgi:signal transduction histidine kinase
MRLRDFIEQNLELIVSEWERFARSLDAGGGMGPLALRDHATDLLRAVVEDMGDHQSELEQTLKSEGAAAVNPAPGGIDEVSKLHAIGRAVSGFDLAEVIAEYRALRASVLKLWHRDRTHPEARDIADVTRFNEAIDQSLTEAVRTYTRRVDESADMFLAILGHDLRTPLNSISMLAQLVQISPDSAREASDAAAQILASVENMSRMISDLLVFTGARMGMGLPTTPQSVDLAALCEEAAREVRAANPELAVSVRCSGTASGMWDPVRLHQALSNLISNAAQHGMPGQPVSVAIAGEPTEVVITVHNHGTPIPPEMLSSIFKPLVQGSSQKVRKHRRPGSIGLGLYIVREIATAHGGTISVTSSHANGTVFTLRLPRQPTPA